MGLWMLVGWAVMFAAACGCSQMRPVAVRPDDPRAAVYIDFVQVGTGEVHTEISRNHPHAVVAKNGDKLAAGTLDVDAGDHNERSLALKLENITPQTSAYICSCEDSLEVANVDGVDMSGGDERLKPVPPGNHTVQIAGYTVSQGIPEVSFVAQPGVFYLVKGTRSSENVGGNTIRTTTRMWIEVWPGGQRPVQHWSPRKE